MAKFMVMAGGTGGHVFPALAVANELRDRGHEVFWLGNRKGMEADLVPKHNFPMRWTKITGLRGKGILTLLRAPFALVSAIWEALGVVRSERPDAVLGMGGFVSGPGGLAARMTGRPLVIHEQNAIPGLANRMLSRIATTVLEGFPNSFKDAKHCGNPVRAEISAIAEPERRFTGRQGPLRLLVLGGSLGALRLNENLPLALAKLPAEQRPQVWHQSGKRTLPQAEAAYQTAGVDVRLEAFINDMAEAYAWADVVLCRAGALTLAELAAAGCAAMLVPYPYAVDDHQTANAAWLVEADAAELLKDDEVTPERLFDWLQGLQREQCLQRASAARAQAKPNATGCVADICEGLINA